MNGVRRGWMLLALLAAMVVASGVPALAQIATTTVQDTVYSANGTPATGSVVVSWNAFTTASGQAVAAGSTSATIGAGGVLTMSLAPNAGSTPMGSYYTAVFHLGDGTTSREYWVVPVTVPGGGPATLAAIKNSVLPASVAMQTVSKQYVDQAIAAAAAGSPLAGSSEYVLKAGDTMTGPLVLPADPVSSNQAADKHYVDASVAAVSSGAGQKVSTLPTATQVVAQPAGTQLDVNLLNGEVYASQYVNGIGTNGISNALASADCAAGCKLMVEPTYQGTDQVSVLQFGLNPAGTKTEDQRGGANVQTALNPLAYGLPNSGAQSFAQTETLSMPQLEVLRPGVSGGSARTLALSMQALTGGSNQLVAGAPYGKSTYGALTMTGTYDTQGQHVQAGNTMYCHGVGDCLAGSQYIYSSGGYRDVADEGTHPFDLFVSEDTAVFAGTCAVGCSSGATNLKVNATAGAGTQGDGRFLIDTNPANLLTSGTLTGGGKTSNGTNYGVASFTGTSFPVSVFLSTAQAATSQPKNIAPGTVTLAIATSGVPAGFATSTSALTASTGVACIADVEGSAPTPYYEMANYTVVDGTHLQLTLNKIHAAGATIAVGGLCGYGLEQTVDTTGGIRQLFPVIGSYDATDLYYADGQTNTIGVKSSTSTTGYVNVSMAVTGISRTSNVVTVTTSGTVPGDLNGLSLTVSGVADSSYNGTFVVATTAANTFTYASTGANSTSSGGTVTLLTGGYVLYPMAEVLSVYDAANGQVDGTMTLAANTVAWAAGDTVEEPHYYQQRTYPDTEYVTQYVPRPGLYTTAGKTYQGTVGPGLRGWSVTNGAPASQYLGAGGTHNLPDYAYVVAGAWNRDFDVQAGNQAVIWAHCNLNGCNRWDSTYSLFALDSAAGYGADSLNYSPQSSTATWRLGGSTYSFAPTGFTAATINVGTLNATTITGGVSGAAITSGTVSAARLPVFGPSGASHAAGIVPDPGATAGATRYLREDGSWVAPSGGGGGSGTVTSFGTGSWPLWLTPTVSNAATTPTLAVAASSIPNTALANSATTVNGQSCALGASCTITVGSSAFSSLTSGSNTTAAMVVGTGASLSASGTGTIAATSVPFTGVTGTATVAQLPTGIPNANLANSGTTVNGVVCGLGATCTITAPPATEIKYAPAAVCDGGTAYASGVTRYDNQQPQAGCLLPASSTAAYLAFNAGATLPQYASATIATPTYWTGTSLYLKFAGTATTGNVGWIVDTACTNDGQVVSTATFGTPTTVTTTVSSTLGASVTTAVFANVGVPGTNGCTAGTTVPGSLLTYRIHRSATDTQAGNANLLGVVLVTGRSQ